MSDKDECIKCGGPCANTQEVCVRCVAEEEAEQGIISKEAREIIEAVVNGAPVCLLRDYWDEGVHFRIYQVESALAEPQPVEDTTCPTCYGKGYVQIFADGIYEQEPCPTCPDERDCFADRAVGIKEPCPKVDNPCPTCEGSGEKRVYDGGISGEWIEVPCDDPCHGTGKAKGV